MHANTIETTANQQGWTLHTGFAGGQWLETSSPAGEDLIIDVPSGRPSPKRCTNTPNNSTPTNTCEPSSGAR